MPGTVPALRALVTGVNHVGIAVPDMDEAVAWYADTLGLVATHTETNEEQGGREALLSAPGAAAAGPVDPRSSAGLGEEPGDSPWGERMGWVNDPAGNEIVLVARRQNA